MKSIEEVFRAKEKKKEAHRKKKELRKEAVEAVSYHGIEVVMKVEYILE